MKIKRKVQKNLPQLIEWVWKNGMRNIQYVCDNFESKSVVFNNEGKSEFSEHYSYSPEDTFTVEVEEEIDEETKLGLLLDHFINPYGQHYVGNIYQNRSINDVLEENDEMEISTNSIHLFDKETKEFILIWRDGKLVE
ncbi:hypothetical protein [Staphylococcus equorum]|uniref:Phage protein n=1 Tax=Staphylococcus equorum TaxID=246432 RepID=A0A9X4LBC4_9STAP|nr:hypothetical protein [Staphylococcus equorum]MDG0860390.1 hypothetical protein [Staphylococcus equorum]